MRVSQALTVASASAKNLLLGLNIQSLRLARSPRRMVEYTSEALFLYDALCGSRRLDQRNPHTVLAGRNVETIRLGNLNNPEAPGCWLESTVASYTADIVNLCLVTEIIQPKVVFEIGTMHGYTAYHFALNSPADARVFTLDLPRSNARPILGTSFIDELHIARHQQEAVYCFEGTPEAAKIEPLFGDSASFDFAPYEGLVDLFFIDGAHSYEYVRSDTLNALRCCHEGSVILWHDYGRRGTNRVSKWLNEMSRTERLHSVPGGSLAFMAVSSRT